MEIYTFRLPHSGRQSRNRAARMNVFFGGHQTWNRTLESLSLHFPLSFLPLPHSGRQSRNCAARMSASEKSLHFPHSGRQSRNCARGRISFVGGSYYFSTSLPLYLLFLSGHQTWNRTLRGLYSFLTAAVSHGIALEGVSPS
jgi:hypothetical protein